MATLIITAAGLSRRFAEETDITIPKWALKVGGRSLLARVIDGVDVDLAGWRLVVVARSDQAHYVRRCLTEGDWQVTILALEATPNGQALTANHAASRLDPDEPIAIWCADTVILPGTEPLAADGNWLTVAPLEGEQWSFAAVDEDGTVRQTAEKSRIGPHASVGLYGFATAGLFVSAVVTQRCRQEMYVAPLYNDIIAQGHDVRLAQIPANRVAAFGTRAEMVASCDRLGWSLPDEMRQVTVSRLR